MVVTAVEKADFEKTGPKNNEAKKKAYVLVSGGLDSTIAVKMLQDQGIDVTGVYVSTGFCINSHQKKTGRFDESKPDVFKVSEELGIDLEVIDISKEYLSIITKPRYGWGKNVNPCIDCRIHMLKKTRELMEKNRFDFIATGEVLGQRPMSQRRHTSKIIEEKSGLKGLLVRPLSAQLHKETEPEKKGWLDRKKLGRLEGRSRKPQFALAEKYGLKNISTPAGGCCFLTDESYAVRFKDLLRDRKGLLNSDDSQPLVMDTMMLLATGRQVKIRKGLKLILGRNEAENKLIRHYGNKHIMLEADESSPGPTAVLELLTNEKDLDFQNELEKNWDLGVLQKRPETEGSIREIRHFLEDYGYSSDGQVSPDELYLCASILGRYCKNKQGGQNENIFEVNICLHEQKNGEPQTYKIKVLAYPNEIQLNKRLVMKANEENFIEENSN